MSTRRIKVLFKDTSSRHNKELTDFLKRNLKDIIMRGCISFEFVVVRPDDVKKVMREGVNKLPALVDNHNVVVGTPLIVEFLRKAIKNSRTAARVKTSEEQIFDLQRSVVMAGCSKVDGKFQTSEDNDEDGIGKDLIDKTNREAERRRASTKKGAKPTGIAGVTQEPEPDLRPARTTEHETDAETRLDNMSTGGNQQDAMMLKAMMGKIAGSTGVGYN